MALAKEGFKEDGTPLTEDDKMEAELKKTFGAGGVLAKVARKHKGAELTPMQEQELLLSMMKVESLTEKLRTVRLNVCISSHTTSVQAGCNCSYYSMIMCARDLNVRSLYFFSPLQFKSTWKHRRSLPISPPFPPLLNPPNYPPLHTHPHVKIPSV